MRPHPHTLISLASVIILLLLTGCDRSAQTPDISFAKQVQPIFAQHCLECHDTKGAGTTSSGLKLASYTDVMKGTKFGPVIKPGNSLSSTLVILVEGRADAAIKMPHGDRQPLSESQIKTLRLWIDQGAKNN